MINFAIDNPNVTNEDIAKASGRKNLETWLLSKGIVDWSFDFLSRRFTATVVDTFDFSQIADFGTVEVLPSDPGVE